MKLDDFTGTYEPCNKFFFGKMTLKYNKGNLNKEQPCLWSCLSCSFVLSMHLKPVSCKTPPLRKIIPSTLHFNNLSCTLPT